MKRSNDVAPVVVLCIVGVLLVAIIGTVIEWSVGRKSPLWSITASFCPLLLAIIAIHYVKNVKKYFARHIFFRGKDYIVTINYIVWSLILLISGLLFILFVMDTLGKIVIIS